MVPLAIILIDVEYLLTFNYRDKKGLSFAVHTTY